MSKAYRWCHDHTNCSYNTTIWHCVWGAQGPDFWLRGHGPLTSRTAPAPYPQKVWRCCLLRNPVLYMDRAWSLPALGLGSTRCSRPASCEENIVLTVATAAGVVAQVSEQSKHVTSSKWSVSCRCLSTRRETSLKLTWLWRHLIQVLPVRDVSNRPIANPSPFLSIKASNALCMALLTVMQLHSWS